MSIPTSTTRLPEMVSDAAMLMATNDFPSPAVDDVTSSTLALMPPVMNCRLLLSRRNSSAVDDDELPAVTILSPLRSSDTSPSMGMVVSRCSSRMSEILLRISERK